MLADAISRVGVVGCGRMGAGIVEVCATAGLDVVAVETNPVVAAQAQESLKKSLQKAQEAQRISSAAEVLGRIRIESSLETLADRQFVIEAIVENEDAKTSLFRVLADVVTDPDAIFATNTSSIPISRIASVLPRPERLLGVHFFNPAQKMALVEIIPTLLTDAEVTNRTKSFVAESLGKHPIVAPDRSGFVVNALLVPYLLSAIRMLESGAATAEDIDAGMVLGCAHPQGPLALSDLIGLDVIQAVAESLFAEFREPLYAAPPLLARMVDAGLLGRKSGKGFFSY